MVDQIKMILNSLDLNQDDREGVFNRLERTRKLLIDLSSLYGQNAIDEIKNTVNNLIRCITTNEPERCELKFQPLDGWKIKTLNGNDRSIGAFVFLIRNLRNEIKHGSNDDINTVSYKFTTYRNRIEIANRIKIWVRIIDKVNYGRGAPKFDIPLEAFELLYQ